MKYCKYLNEGLVFYLEGMGFCNKLWNEHTYIPYENNFFEKFLEKRKNVIDSIKNNNIEFICSKCVYLKDIDGNSIEINNKIKNLEIYNWDQCNCACFYCTNREITKLKITTKKNQKGKIDVVPYLKKLKEKDLLDDDVVIFMNGGEPTILKEFPNILKFVIKNNYVINILSNGIIYEKLIDKALNSNKNSLFIISLDCGTRETFKKIKGVDKFNDVIKNIKKYVYNQKKINNSIVIKYIILEGVNDNKEEIDKWIETCANLGVTRYFVSIEFCHSVKKTNKKINDNICDLYYYAQNKIRQYNPKFDVISYDFVELFIKNRSYKID